MKKLAIMAVLALATSGAYAGDFGADVTHNGSTGADSAGIVFGQQVGVFGVEGSLDRQSISFLPIQRLV